MKLPPAPAAYSATNEQTARNILEAAALKTRKVDVASEFVLLIDQVTQEVGKLTVESGVFVWTPE